uniref:UBZ4-type domain-containing protein n=1 Tax=Piliocolobus tephrosceles TaxID=591936 RepID=A0A8C9I4Y8_9PRIM
QWCNPGSCHSPASASQWLGLQTGFHRVSHDSLHLLTLRSTSVVSLKVSEIWGGVSCTSLGGKIRTKAVIIAICHVLQVGNKEDAEKEVAISTFSSSNQVSCPLCNQSFPPTKIERHAMYCNVLMGEDTVLTRRQKEAKTKSDSGTAAQTSLDIDKNEKCYLCKSLVPFREYQCHVDSCLQLAKADQGDGPEGSGRACSSVERKQQQRLWNPKEKGHSEGRLLSFLEQSEHKTSGEDPRTSFPGFCLRVPSPGMEEAGCSREMQSSCTHRDLNESPIKSFISISEATDCLVDFKKQVTVQPGSRTRTKAGRGRRRKF